MIDTVSKHEELYDHLWEELIKLSPGEKFLSIREIMKRYSVSQLIADKTLARFRSDGYLTALPGKGLYASERVKRLDPSMPPSYMLAVPQWISTDIDTLEATVEKLKPQYAGTRLIVHKFDVSNNIPPYLPLLEENVAGLIILPASNLFQYNDIKRLQSFSCPVVVLGRRKEAMGCLTVGADDVFAGNLAAHHLIENGHRRIAILISEPHNEIIMDRVKAVADYAELRSAEIQYIDCDVKSGEHASDKTYHKFAEYIRKGFDFTGLIGVSGESIQGAINVCLNNGIKIPEDLSIVAIGAENLSATFHPQIDAIAVDYTAQVDKAVSMLDDLVNGQTHHCSNIDIRPYIIERESVRKLNNS